MNPSTKINLPVKQVYNDLILESFETKDVESCISKLRTQLTSDGYDFDNRLNNTTQAPQDMDEACVLTLLLFINMSKTYKRIGSYNLLFNSVSIDGSRFELVGIWLKSCGAKDISYVHDMYTLWYSDPDIELTNPSPSMKDDIIMKIEFNKSQSGDSLPETVFGERFNNSLKLNNDISTMSSSFFTQANTATNINQLSHDVSNQTDENVAIMVQWLKDSGFDQAHSIKGQDSTTIKLA